MTIWVNYFALETYNTVQSLRHNQSSPVSHRQRSSRTQRQRISSTNPIKHSTKLKYSDIEVPVYNERTETYKDGLSKGYSMNQTFDKYQDKISNR